MKRTEIGTRACLTACLLAMSACLAVEGATAAYARPIVPAESRDYAFSKRWVNPKRCGRTFWLTFSTPFGKEEMDILAQFGHDKRFAHYGRPTLERRKRIRGEHRCRDPRVKRVFERVRLGEIPALSHGPPVQSPDGVTVVPHPYAPSKEEIGTIIDQLGERWLGWAAFNEWGIRTDRMARYFAGGAKRDNRFERQNERLFRAIWKDHLPIRSRKAFVAAAERAWRAFSEPYDYQVIALDNEHYWALQWPAFWGARAIIGENRTPSVNVAEFQAFVRGAARMGNIPYGLWPAHDWYTYAVTPSLPKHVNDRRSSRNKRPADAYRKARGWQFFLPDFFRRTTYYMCMSNPLVVADESYNQRYVDANGDGNYRLTWYGQMWEEVMDFADRHPDRGTPYTPVGIALNWESGFQPWGSKAFNQWDYDYGEHMTREFFHSVVWPNQERRGHQQDLFGASPHGDIFDPLRIDTPNGPLPMDLLRDYRVLFCVGHQNIDAAVAARLKEYVAQGGVLVLNVKQLSEQLDRDFLGVAPGSHEREADRMTCLVDGKELTSGAFKYTPLKLQSGADALYMIGDDVAVSRHPYRKGFVLVVAAHWMLETKIAELKVVRWMKRWKATMLPLADDLLGRLVKPLLPFEVRGEHVRDRVLHQVNRKGKGWVVALYNNAGRETQYGRGPEKIWPDRRVDVEMVVAPDTKDAVEWLGHRRLRFVKQGGQRLLRVPLEPGEVRIVETQPSTIPALRTVEPVNLALNRPVTASSSAPKHGPERAVDGQAGIYDAWWSDHFCPQWLQVDLGKAQRIRSIKTIMMWSEDNRIFPRIYQYYVETSVDGKTWSRLLDETGNLFAAHRRGHHRHFDPVQARYVRVTVTRSTAGAGGQIVELEVYGDEKAIKVCPW